MNKDRRRAASARFKVLALFVAFTFLFSNAALAERITSQSAQQASSPSAPQSRQQIAAKIDEYMQASTRLSRFTGSILVARNNQLIASKGYGMANFETATPNTPQTKFRIGSLTKQFTAMGIVMLQERSKLNVNDSVCKYLDACPAAWQPITIRNLLTHTSGIQNYTRFPDFAQTRSQIVNPASFIETFKNKPLEFAPGEKFNYSNSGYYLLGLIIERASGKPYAEFLRENIFIPLGMTNTGYENTRTPAANLAVGYSSQGDTLAKASHVDVSVPYAAGALSSTTEDMLRWDAALYTTKLVSQKSLDEIFTPFKNNYGYGWGITKKYNRPVVAHDGSINGFTSFIARFPDDRVTVVVLSNNEDAPSQRIGGALSAIVFGENYKIRQERRTVALDPKSLDAYAGQYQLAPTFIITVTNENGKLMAQATNQPKFELFAESETKFFLKAVDAQVTFVKDAGGRITQLILHQNGRDLPAPKIK